MSLLQGPYPQGCGDVGRAQAVAGTGHPHGGATQGATVSHAGKHKRIKKLAPCSVRGAVLGPMLAGKHWPHGAGPLSGKNNGHYRDWANLHRGRKDAGLGS